MFIAFNIYREIIIVLFFCVTGCPFGDRFYNCSTVEPFECYTREFECCATCPMHKKSGKTLSAVKHVLNKHRGCGNIPISNLQAPLVNLPKAYGSSR